VAKQYCCKTCGAPLPLLVVAHRDEFCSTKCARQYYGHRRNNTIFRRDRLAGNVDGSFKPVPVITRT
jgi:hypothetical protein